jgi:hypothetical protein
VLPLVEIPELVRHYASFFASVFSPDAFVQFQRYVSGLIVSENKTIDGINPAALTCRSTSAATSSFWTWCQLNT